MHASCPTRKKRKHVTADSVVLSMSLCVTFHPGEEHCLTNFMPATASSSLNPNNSASTAWYIYVPFLENGTKSMVAAYTALNR